METFLLWHPVLFNPERVPVALIALLLVCGLGAVTGGVAHSALPFFWQCMDAMTGALGRKLDRRQRKAADLAFRGFFILLTALVISYLAGRACELAAARTGWPTVISIASLSLLLTAGAIWNALLGLHGVLLDPKAGKGAYLTLSRSSRIDFSSADTFAAIREGMALAARMFAMGMVAPLFWYLAGGLTAAFLYAGLAATAWQFGKDGFSKGFGSVALALEKILGIVPAILAAAILSLAGLFTPTGGLTPALSGFLRRKGKAPYAQGGPPLTALAGALNVTLGGPAVDRGGSAWQRAWAGPPGATAQLGAWHIKRAVYLIVMAHLLLAMGLGVAILWINLR